jgi:hypothetical protein
MRSAARRGREITVDTLRAFGRVVLTKGSAAVARLPLPLPLPGRFRCRLRRWGWTAYPGWRMPHQGGAGWYSCAPSWCGKCLPRASMCPPSSPIQSNRRRCCPDQRARQSRPSKSCTLKSSGGRETQGEERQGKEKRERENSFWGKPGRLARPLLMYSALHCCSDNRLRC